MKKFISMTIIIFATLFSIQCSGLSTVSTIAEASDVWVYGEGGGDYYVVTDTFQKYSDSHFTVDIKMVFPGNFVGNPSGQYGYEFKKERRTWIYTMSEMSDYYLPVSDDIVAQRILRYCLNNLM